MSDARARDFQRGYARDMTEAERDVEREVFGSDEGIWGYTTPAQATALIGHLELGPDKLLLDIGCGRGWPSVYLARTAGCAVVATDFPAASPRNALLRAEAQGVEVSYSAIRASGTHLPFRSRVFDAVVHTDVL